MKVTDMFLWVWVLFLDIDLSQGIFTFDLDYIFQFIGFCCYGYMDYNFVI